MHLMEQARQIFPDETGVKITAVYILRLASGMLYVGSTTDLIQRMADHIAGIACKTTRDTKPISLIYVEPQKDYSSARKREAQFKRWSRAKKEALASGDLDSLRQLSKSRESQ